METAIFGGGCFWCIEATMRRLRGVGKVTSGYAGGTTPNPTYTDVCGGETGHAEVVQVEFDPSIISYHDLLAVFFTVHDPTTVNRQGHDVGTQYRSVIFTTSAAQHAAAASYKAELERDHVFPSPIVTEILPLPAFFPAEADHQRYYDRNPDAGYCQAIIAPKVAKLRAQWAHLLAE